MATFLGKGWSFSSALMLHSFCHVLPFFFSRWNQGWDFEFNCIGKFKNAFYHFRCPYDYLALYDGPNVNSTLLGKYCGHVFHPVTSTGRFLTLYFVTNNYQQYKGFELRYNWTHTTIRKTLLVSLVLQHGDVAVHCLQCLYMMKIQNLSNCIYHITLKK